MNKLLQILMCFLLLVLVSCRKKALDDFYARPSNLADPIYQQLNARGNFKSILSLIDRAGYKQILSSSGYWTFFAPNDSAVSVFLQQRGLNDVSQINDSTATAIVKYALVQDSYRKDQLSSQQTDKGLIPNIAFKRKTSYYDFVYTEKGRKLIASNSGIQYNPTDNNYKSIPYFLNNLIGVKGFKASDYTSFYPGSLFTGFNVAEAKVLEADITAENGIIHVLDKVITPLPNIEQYTSTKSDYSEFQKLLDRWVSFVPSAEITHRYQVLSKATDSVYIKQYSPLLGFSPNNENYSFTSIGGTSTQIDGYTFAAPTNDAVKNYTKQILKYYKNSFDQAPPSILLDFINSHMWPSTVWPNRLTSAGNTLGDKPTFSEANVIERKILSNGIFYGINKVQEANVFRTVYSAAYLNPKYALMTRALNTELKFNLISPTVKWTMFMMSDDDIRAAGYDYNSNFSQWQYTVNGVTAIDDIARNNFYRILNTSVFQTSNGELDDLSGKGFVEAWNGQYIKYQNNTIRASGNYGTDVVTIDSAKSLADGIVNGKAYFTKGILKLSTRTLGEDIELLAKPLGTANAFTDPKYGHFYNYLINSAALWKADTKDIIGTSSGQFYTILIPTNAAIMTAISQGLLPKKSDGSPEFNPTSTADIAKVTNFILFHIINKSSIVTDGKKNGTAEVLLKDANDSPKYVAISGTNGNMMVTDEWNNTANVDLANSNYLANSAIIHSINKVLNYNNKP